jgi:hypothetical protein
VPAAAGAVGERDHGPARSRRDHVGFEFDPAGWDAYGPVFGIHPCRLPARRAAKPAGAVPAERGRPVRLTRTG